MRGFSVPLVLIAVLLVGGLAFFTYSNTKSDDVMGVSTSVVQKGPGVTFSVISKTPAWDLVEYLCESAEACLTSVGAGTRLGTTSGGATELREVTTLYSPDWNEYSYLKIFARPSWIVGDPAFRVVTPGDVPGTLIEKIPSSGEYQDVVLIPLKEISDTYYKSATFSDR
ncbi:hypothetical protein HN803_05435 [candidate division WWE3 bacterium]|nr:hypothetical protein [candidate division WWE3 bacterium]MBT7350205.1 hypothetical protein [candidate division WWE3 bacterium]